MIVGRAVIAMACLLCLAVASAQEYSIRANRGLNLRAAPSLSADIAATARSGDVLHVVAHVGDWLKIDRGGSEAWLADWVNYSRLDQEPARTAASAQVDNCCYVDRQCRSDQEWIEGYYAYRNQQCAAPPVSLSQPGASPQPVSGATSDVDNCCYVDRQCRSDQEWADGFYAYQNGQCASASPAAVNRASIEGSPTFIAQINATLDLLKRRTPRWYAYVTIGPRVIRESYPGAPDGYAAGDMIHISPSAAAKPAHVLAHLLVHEACHVQRALAGLLRYGTAQEQDFEEDLAEYVAADSTQHIQYGRSLVTYTPAQVARLTRYGVLEVPAPRRYTYYVYVSRTVSSLLRAGVDFFGAVRAEIARADRLLHS